ncbi:GNAT family N-acetyltransferase [Staphylococcus gallinarum]|uniref:GNAT family N-acetyltransferase n=1 Tax=Staphylococcus gallinarum TaxID=1293 RepID=UPI000D1FAB06|nr:GNAT family N-acetyltransferase [Staphylococcus gallinarum]PTK92646.1 GNAT family N-acetyltransferase [Staphylococcus gallinarum]PTK94292.1 GNAT family N-acetyltransferase [Staphylococcus gallinarum]RIO91010.1 GNAT family N-acetyltransferase [Staphylococcus gallinarum]
MMEFRELTMSDESLYCDYMSEWIDHDEQVVPAATNIVKYDNFETLVHELADNKSRNSEIDNTTLFLIDENEIIGAANIRHDLNDHLKRVGGHIGYGVRKKHRGKGYGNKLLKKSLDYLSRIGVQEALVTCDESNKASAAVIKHNGGEEIEPALLDDGTVIRRFQIEIS